MTLVVAFKWLQPGEEAIVISSDSKATYGPVTYDVRKIYPITSEDGKLPLAVAGGAGDLALVNYAYSTAESIIRGRAKKINGNQLTYEEFDAAIRDVESTLTARFTILSRQRTSFEFGMILASLDPRAEARRKASMYVFDGRGLADPVHDSPGFAIIGRGAFTGGTLLLRLLGYSPEEFKGRALGVLSAFVIDAVSEVDPSVGPLLGQSWLMRSGNGKVVLSPLTKGGHMHYKKDVQQRKELIRILFRLCDYLGEEQVMIRLRKKSR